MLCYYIKHTDSLTDRLSTWSEENQPTDLILPQEIRSMKRVSANAVESTVPLRIYLTCNHSRSKVTVPVESSLVASYLIFFESSVASLTVFEN